MRKIRCGDQDPAIHHFAPDASFIATIPRACITIGLRGGVRLGMNTKWRLNRSVSRALASLTPLLVSISGLYEYRVVGQRE